MNKSQAGRLGGLSTLRKHGKKHMQNIGKQGAAVTWSRYTLKPVGQSQYAMVNRQDNTIKAIINPNNFQWRMQ